MIPKSALILICGLPYLAFATNRASPNEDTLQTSSASVGREKFITLDAGVYPFDFLSDQQTGWYPTVSPRIGFGLTVATSVIFYTHVDYYRFHMASVGNSSYLPKSAKREDLALYAGFLVGQTIDVGLGVYYTTSEKVDIAPLLSNETLPWAQSGWSAYRFFFTIGVVHEFKITDRLFLPVGFYYREAGYGSAIGPLFLRLGIGLAL
jgi:hypothetical protein